jgi:tRNA (guanosine-2'-O-)-methyltransferase
MPERTNRRKDRIREVLEQRQPDLAVVIENVHDIHNVMAISRSCDATGVLDLFMLYNIETPPNLNKHGKRSSAGVKKWIRWNEYESPDECFTAIKAKGMKIYASRLDENAASIYDLDLTQPVALIFGNETRGVSDEAVEAADATFQIPMIGMVQSLNVSVAAAVTLYEAFRQRVKAGLYDETRLDTTEIEQIAKEWLEK